MSQSYTIRSMSPYQWKLHLAIRDADEDPRKREAPWYCAWDLVLRDHIFTDFCGPPYITLTYPQFPLSRGIDTYHPADDIIVKGADSDEDDDNNSESDHMSRSPSPSFQHSQTPPNQNRFMRHGAPSPEPVFKGSPSPGSKPAKLSPPGKKSTRIPDFAQLLYQIRMNQDGSIPNPIQYRKYSLLLIVEIKKCPKRPFMIDFMPIFFQTDQQARRAFVMFPGMRKLGGIIAIGAYWTYVEYDRDTIRPSPSLSERQDATYVEHSTATLSYAKGYPPFHALCGPEGCVRLETQNSNAGLALVRTRVKQLSGIGM